MNPYLTLLALRLTAAAASLPDDLRRRQAAWLAKAQRDDGGFAGREGASDLYYTNFGLRGLSMLGELTAAQAEAAAGFLCRQRPDELRPVDLLSLVQSGVLLEQLFELPVFDRLGATAAAITLDGAAPYRRSDGGWSKSQRSGTSSTYHTFLTTACLTLAGVDVPEAPQIVALIRSRQRDDGGFVELGPLRRGGTNPTAAAVGLLRMLDALDDATRAGAARFLRCMQNAEGGLRANAQIPAADLLSTFTGALTLVDLEAIDMIDRGAARRYVEALAAPEGGFRGGLWDQTADVEYTFYGLGALALLTAA